jgi:hypothetical protein
MSHHSQTAHEPENDTTSEKAETEDVNLSQKSSKPKQAANDPDTVSPADETLNKLNNLCVNDKLEELEREVQSATYVAGELALQGQITVWFAGPNTGKTLLALKLVSDARQANGDDLQIFHLNLDDGQKGIIDKAHLGNRQGFRVMTPDVLARPLDNFTEIVEELVDSQAAKRTLFILDTIKKFTDVMDKGSSSRFMTLCRRFTAAGGTIIALAHTNKHEDVDGRPVPGGTSDVRDDSDCAYVMQIEREEPIAGGVRRYVKFSNDKARGAVARNAMYSYEVNDEGDYHRMFYSVKQANAGELEELQRKEQIEQEQRNDEGLIQTIREHLSGQSWSQTDLVRAVMGNTSASRNQALGCLSRWSCAAEDGGLWVKTAGDNNAKIYTLPHTPQETGKPSKPSNTGG